MIWLDWLKISYERKQYRYRYCRLVIMTEKELCLRLCEIDGTAGDEKEIAKKAQDILSQYMKTEIDTLGNVVAKFNEDGKIKIVLEAHMDRVGLVIRGIDEKGFLLIDKVGGTDARTLIGANVVVFGGERIPGVICSTPPHLMKKGDEDSPVDVTKLAIDIGLSKEKAQQLVSIGDRAVIESKGVELLDDRISSAALDDRAGMASVIIAVENVIKRLKNVSLTVVFSTQEEVGGSGAKTAAFNFDADYAICVDVGFGGDLLCDRTQTIDLEKGASIGISPVLDRAFMIELKETAKKHGIPFQHDVMAGRTGTNADNICNSKGGVKTALLSIPLRNMHTPVEVISTKDIKLTADLISAFILEKEEQYNA